MDFERKVPGIEPFLTEFESVFSGANFNRLWCRSSLNPIDLDPCTLRH